ncbi:MAG TPA: hypothetical protein DEB24_03435 [Coriobacteriia bacterium]|nr:hypothetical protein [Coriobacteriia bacterium]
MKHAKKKVNRLLPLWMSLGAVFVVLLAAYFIGVGFFSSHFLPNTSIDGKSVTLMTQKEVEADIESGLKDYTLQVSGREGLNKTYSAADLGLQYIPDGQVWRILKAQNPWLWFTKFFGGSSETATEPSTRFDIDKFNAVLDTSDFYKDENMRPPANAYITFVENAYAVVSEDAGTLIDKPKVRRAFADAIHTMDSAINLEEADCYAGPEIFGNNRELIDKVNLWNQHVPFSITYLFGDEQEILDGTTTMSWINEDGSFNESAMRAWVKDFGKRHDTVGTARQFTTIDGETITVEGGGNYGWEVDENAEIRAILDAVANHTGEVREPHYVQTAVNRPGGEQPEWGNTYIELNLSKQHMWYIVDGAVQMEADVVTGLPGRNATPPGVYNILQMSSPATLVGEIQPDGEPEYRTKVSFWMRMTWAGHGFHDATWQPWFGGNRYTYAGSHGCINMSYNDAKTLYNLIYEGLPVISHY